MEIPCPTSSFHHRITDLGWTTKNTLRLFFEEVFFCGWAEHVLSFMVDTMDIYISSSSMDHRISSLLILASCKSAYNRLLRLIELIFPSAFLLSSAIYNWLSLSNRVHASILVVVISLSPISLDVWLLSLFKIDFDFGLSCNSFHMIYFILSCVISSDIHSYLIVLP